MQEQPKLAFLTDEELHAYEALVNACYSRERERRTVGRLVSAPNSTNLRISSRDDQPPGSTSRRSVIRNSAGAAEYRSDSGRRCRIRMPELLRRNIIPDS